MEVGKTFQPKSLKEVRKWFLKHHKTEKDIWFIFYTKESGKHFVPYIDILDEALCFGWIDSIVKKIDKDSCAQRFSPRRPKSPVSELNKAKMRRLVKEGRMTATGLAVVDNLDDDDFEIPSDVLIAIQEDSEIWKNFKNFPENYQRLKIRWITAHIKDNPKESERRLVYFLKMTKKNKKYGSEQ